MNGRGEHVPDARIVTARRSDLQLDIETVWIADCKLLDARDAESRTPRAFDTWLGLSIHAMQRDRERIIAARRAFLAEQIKKEKATPTAIGTDAGQRARIAAVMVGQRIDQFEVELRWLGRALDAFTDN